MLEFNFLVLYFHSGTKKTKTQIWFHYSIHLYTLDSSPETYSTIRFQKPVELYTPEVGLARITWFLGASTSLATDFLTPLIFQNIPNNVPITQVRPPIIFTTRSPVSLLSILFKRNLLVRKMVSNCILFSILSAQIWLT